MALLAARSCCASAVSSRRASQVASRGAHSSRRPAVRCVAALASRSARVSVLPRLAACVEVQGALSRYESVAGRSAMIGFLAGLVTEAVADRGLFENMTMAGLGGVAAFMTAGLALGAALALGTREQLGAPLMEVLASLSSFKRTPASASGYLGIDEALEAFLENYTLDSIDADDLDLDA